MLNVAIMMCLITLGQTPPPMESIPLSDMDEIMVQYEGQYEDQLASRDPLQAMAVLDSLAGLAFFKVDGYELSWNPQDRELVVSLYGLPVQNVSTGIDGMGRQTFQVSVPDADPITGWVDVDMVRNRIITQVGRSTVGVAELGDNDDGTIAIITAMRQECVCFDNSNHPIKKCDRPKCSARDRGCRRRSGNPPRDTLGSCKWVTPADNEGGGCGSVSIQQAPVGMVGMSFIGGYWRRRRPRRASKGRG